MIDIINEENLSIILLGSIGSIFALLIIYISKKIISNSYKLIGKIFKSKYDAFVKEHERLVRFEQEKNIPGVLSYYFFHLTHFILWIFLSSISFIASLNYSNQNITTIFLFTGSAFLFYAMFSSGSSLIASYSYFTDKNSTKED